MNKLGIPVLALAGLSTYDLLQKRRSILRTFPVVGHLRYAVEAIGPELRQYIVTDNNTSAATSSTRSAPDTSVAAHLMANSPSPHC